jgi:hypothetical protein
MPSRTVSITVLTVKPVNFGKIFALASVEIDIDGVVLVIHGVRAIRVLPMGTRIDLPMFRDESGVWRRAITLPDEICGSIGKAVPPVSAIRDPAPSQLRSAALTTKLCYRFGPLTPSARSANLTAGDGTKNGLPAPNKKLSAQPKTTI